MSKSTVWIIVAAATATLRTFRRRGYRDAGRRETVQLLFFGEDR